MSTNAIPLFAILTYAASTNNLPTDGFVLPHRTLVDWSETKWIPIPGNYKVENGSNTVKEAQTTFSRQRIQVITVVTNWEDFQMEKMTTNGVTRWNPHPTPPPLPGTPGRQ